MKISRNIKIIIGLCLAISIIFFSLGTLLHLTNTVEEIISIDGGSNQFSGTMWRLNQTNYIVWIHSDVHDFSANLESNYALANYSQCYQIFFGAQSPVINLNFTRLPLQIYNETECSLAS